MRVLITGTNFHNYLFSIEKAFTELGWNTLVQPTQLYKFKQSYSKNILNKILLPSVDYFFSKNNISTQKQNLFNIIKNFSPDLILIYKGNDFDVDYLESIKKQYPDTKIVLWLMDPISSMKDILDNLSTYHHVFLYDKNDIQTAMRYNNESFFLPLAFDPVEYFPKKMDEHKKWKISFIGNLNKFRLGILEEVISNLNMDQNSIKIVNGLKRRIPIYTDNSLNKQSWLYKKNYIDKRSLNARQINDIYNQSLICLNIHRPDIIQGYNMRFFEIPGSGGIQIVERLQGIEEQFSEENKEIITYSSVNELISKIKYFLANPNSLSEFSTNGHKRAINNHTFRHRVEFLISKIV